APGLFRRPTVHLLVVPSLTAFETVEPRNLRWVRRRGQASPAWNGDCVERFHPRTASLPRRAAAPGPAGAGVTTTLQSVGRHLSGGRPWRSSLSRINRTTPSLPAPSTSAAG